MRTYNGEDCNLCYGIFKHLKPHYSAAELWQIDAVVRMRTEPVFELDRGLLSTAATVERSRKYKALLDLAAMLRREHPIAPEPSYDGADPPDFGADQHADFWGDEDAVAEFVRAELASTPKFSALLERLGVEVPMKPSPTDPEKTIPALSKTDEAFIELQEDDNEIVAAAARTRLDVKSTILETRIEKFVTAGRLAGGLLPIPLRYCGADTTGRDSGEEYNPQNLPRVNKKKPKIADALRRSLRAPKGKAIIVADQSGIELRVNHFLWQVPETMEMYRASPDKADLYRAFAALYYGKSPADVDPTERQFGKVCHLGLGFGAGGMTFTRVARNLGGIRLTLEEAESAVLGWRAQFSPIVDGWNTCGRALNRVYEGVEEQVDSWGLVHTCKDGFVLPSGRLIRYPELHMEDDGKWPDGRKKRSWMYGVGRHKARINGPKADENIVQALARDSVFDCALEFYKLTGMRPALRVHDELVYVVDEADADVMLAGLQSVMRTPPKWWPELVVWSEGGVGETYADAK
jgi:hypothetical protein